MLRVVLLDVGGTLWRDRLTGQLRDERCLARLAALLPAFDAAQCLDACARRSLYCTLAAMRRRDLGARILELQQGDPFAHVISAASEHRRKHGRACGLYPAGPHVMRLAATLARASGAERMLDLGTGFGYSALWLAAAVATAQVEAVDQFQEHVSRAREFAHPAGVLRRIHFIRADAAEYLRTADGPYDFIHDDAWFGCQPAYFDRLVQVLKPGGVLSMPNWFLLQDALTGTRYRRWSTFAGPDWPATTLAYAEHLARDPRLDVTWTQAPPLGIAIKR